MRYLKPLILIEKRKNCDSKELPKKIDSNKFQARIMELYPIKAMMLRSFSLLVIEKRLRTNCCNGNNRALLTSKIT